MFEDGIDQKKSDKFALSHSPANRPEDEDYLYRRAEQELELAQAATHPAVVKAHYMLADHYLESLTAAEGAAHLEG
ncbi:hypothetical protein FHS31_000464 [Sphingomonas vulcanisoli]|uniref:DUF4167 domain-containing protein n=1 Tax=Sphingomonas vulcanisoli TaxID=1658060 RepID=A0ABX0TR71_9SPHN|nr:hypothetical protein [Sphingomonas vulcanisoli]NIJ06882.1 hypothetical protein [Sphingomonas vulcanisoli]